jgi:glycosyltransferase involved in cell wall biosynthesis/SAM-dependent methyltransferase
VTALKPQTRPLRVVALATYPDDAACTRFRISQYIDLLGAEGAQVTLLPFLTRTAFRHLYDPRKWLRTGLSLVAGMLRRIGHLPAVLRADVIFIQREAMLLGPPMIEWFAMRIGRRPLVLDLDDATYLDHASSVYGKLSKLLKASRKTDRLIDWSSLVICGNDVIADHVRARGRPAEVMPTIVDTSLFSPRTYDFDRPVPIIGWVGSHSTTEYFNRIIPVLEKLGREFRFRVRIVGAGQPISIPGVDVESLPWRQEREVFDFQTLDIGVYPLPNDVWAEAKSGLKAIEYLSVGVPFVASPVGVVAHLGNDGETHFLAETAEEWYDALARLLADRNLRRTMGAAARDYAVANFSVKEFGITLYGLLRQAQKPKPRIRAATTQKPSPSMISNTSNVDSLVVSGFGDEWKRFDQTAVDETELRELFEGYFGVFPWESLPPNATGMDMGCGSGRWARLVAPRVGKLICIDASEEAAAVAKRNLAAHPNCEVIVASVHDIPIADASLDFAYTLGVLHHVPDTVAGLRSCAAKLKPGAPLLVYLYYALDNRPFWFRLIWHISNPVRLIISRLPHTLRYFFSQALAAVVYWPLARLARALERAGMNVELMPLSYYRRRSFYVMRTDVLDRFGTRLEQRFTRDEIVTMMRDAGLENIRFSDSAPFWCAVGMKT